MLRNDPKSVRSILEAYVADDDLVLEWTSGAPETPIDDGYPTELKIKSVDGVWLTSVFALTDGFNTVLSALGTTPEDFKKSWPYARPPFALRIRRVGQTFEIRHAK